MHALYLILFVFALLPVIATAQSPVSCKEEFYLKELVNADSTFQLVKMTTLSDGDLIVCGATHYNTSGAGTLARIRSDGSIVWHKSYSLPGGTYFFDVVILNDGNLAVASTEGSVWKIATNGAVIWHRSLNYGTVESSGNISISSDPQNNIYLTGFFYENGLSFQDRIAFRKLDANGNLVFSKMIKGTGNMTVTYPFDLLIHEGAGYVTGYFHNYYFYSGFLMKFNITSGNLEWTRLYNFNGADLSLHGITTTSTGFLLTGRDHINVNDTAVLLETDINGIPLRSHYFESRLLRDYEQFTTDSDGSVYFGASTFNSFDGNAMRLLLGKIDLATGPVWTKTYDLYSSFGRITSVVLNRGSLFYTGGVFPDNYSLYSILGKIDLEGNTACNAEDTTLSWGTAHVSVRDTLLFDYDKPMIASILSPVVNNITPGITDKCVVESVCDSLSMNEDTIKTCINNDTIAVTFYKNPECLLPVILRYDTSYVRWIKTVGNAASFVPLREGSSKIYAIITADCGELVDSTLFVYHPANPLTLGNDTSFCAGPVILNAPDNYASYTWNTGELSKSISVNQPGVYTLTVTDVCGKVQTDEILVTKQSAGTISLGADRSICLADTIHINAPAGFATYLWSPAGDITNITTNKVWTAPASTTTFSVHATSADGCTFNGSMKVNVHTPLPLNLGNDTTICEGKEIVLNASPAFDQYKWNEGSRDFMVTVQHEGVYHVEAVASNGCISRDTVEVKILDTPQNILNSSYSFCKADPKIITPNGSFTSYKWSNGDTTSVLLVEAAGIYNVEVSAPNGCKAVATTQVIFDECYKGIAYPNAFSPNGDGINETYKPVIGVPISNYEFTIYNRWGQLVFRTTDIMVAWDGRVNGKNPETGNYTWKCVYQQNGKTLQIDKGVVILVR